MKLTVNKPTEIEAAAIRVVLPVRYDEEDIPNNFPLRKGDQWQAVIDIDTGQIRDWPGTPEPVSLAMKVVDEGCYYLLDRSDGVLAAREEDYVPPCLPGEYGDYVSFQIDPTGRIKNWDCDSLHVRRSFFSDDE